MFFNHFYFFLLKKYFSNYYIIYIIVKYYGKQKIRLSRTKKTKKILVGGRWPSVSRTKSRPIVRNPAKNARNAMSHKKLTKINIGIPTDPRHISTGYDFRPFEKRLQKSESTRTDLKIDDPYNFRHITHVTNERHPERRIVQTPLSIQQAQAQRQQAINAQEDALRQQKLVAAATRRKAAQAAQPAQPAQPKLIAVEQALVALERMKQNLTP
jgi:hypothetical protein